MIGDGDAVGVSAPDEVPVKASVVGASDTPVDTAGVVAVGVVVAAPATTMAGAAVVKAKGAEKILG